MVEIKHKSDENEWVIVMYK